MSLIHPTAVVAASSKIAAGVEIGPYSIIGDHVTIDSDCWIGPHVVIDGPCYIGAGTRIFQFASVGAMPQDKKFAGENSRLEIGCRNTIRECVTINRGTEEGGELTRIGDDNWIMAYVHIAHDCSVGSGTVFANGASLAGHVSVEDYVTLGGFTLVHQFCRLGTGAFTSMGSCIRRDVPPWVMVAGDPAKPHGTNSEGLRRHGFDSQAQQRLRNVYRTIYKRGLRLEQAISEIEDKYADDAAVISLLNFIRGSQRGIVR